MSTRATPIAEQPRWEDLATRGVIVIPDFLTANEVALLLADYHGTGLASNRNVNIKHVSHPVIDQIRDKLMAVADHARRSAGVDVDRIVGGGYFAIELGINNEWHQDHESYFLFQEHFHYLNFWIPIEKPDPRLTNLSVVPLDVIRARVPEIADSLIGGGALRGLTGAGQSNLHGDDAKTRHVHLDFDLDDVSETPEVKAGDLVLLRGDVFHRTQDVATQRIAVSLRLVGSKSMVSKRRLLAGGPVKRRMLQSNPLLYALALQCFHVKHVDEVTVGELLDHLHAPRPHPIQTAISLLELALSWQMALPPAHGFTRVPPMPGARDGYVALLRVGVLDAIARRWPAIAGRYRLADDAHAELRRVLVAIPPAPLTYARALAGPVWAMLRERVRALF